jgi:succinate dehydrogenase/fumarate reductase-like Fe-S protein
MFLIENPESDEIMSGKKIKVKIYRFDPTIDKEGHYQRYEVPYEYGMSAMNALDYIYQNLDGTIAYYDHAACGLGVCGRCTGKINGKPGLLCRTPVDSDTTLEPIAKYKVIKDLIIRRKNI